MAFFKNNFTELVLKNRGTGWGIILLALSFCLCNTMQGAQKVILAWNDSVNSGATGYFIYSGSTSGVYTNKTDIGTNTAVTVSGLQEGQTYYFTVTAYNPAKIESAPSDELKHIAPGLLRLCM
jgi:uncharacterized membrane protein